MDTHLLWARPLKIAHVLFLRPWSAFLDAFLKKRMAPLTWKSEGSAKYRIEICNLVVCN